MGAMPTLGLKLPLRICVLENAACVEDAGGRRLRFVKGPIFANIILADEINRTPPKTQAALLEAMQEHRVTI